MAFVALPMAGWSLDQPRRWFSKETANGFSFSFEGRRPGWGLKHTSFRLDASFGHVASSSHFVLAWRRVKRG